MMLLVTYAFDRSPESITCTTLPRMAMGIRDGEQSPLWVVTADLPKSPGHPFYARLNALLEANDFDRVRGEEMPGLLRGGHGTTEPDARPLFPVAAAWLFRGNRLGTRHRVARDGLVGHSQFSGARRERRAARSFDDFSHAAPD